MMLNKFNREYFIRYDGGNLISTKWLYNLIRKLPHNGKILDVGCGKASHLKEIHKIRPDLKLYGVDIGDVKEYIPNFVTFKKASGDELPFKNETFNFILCLHVLEHVLNPHDFFAEFYRVLKKKGGVYVEMPYYKTAHISDGGNNFWSDPTHIRPYSYRSIECLFKQNKFEIKRIFIWRNWVSVLLGPYLILKRILFKDRDALSTFFSHLYGNSVGGFGTKSLISRHNENNS